jgi:hypothetical protein
MTLKSFTTLSRAVLELIDREVHYQLNNITSEKNKQTTSLDLTKKRKCLCIWLMTTSMTYVITYMALFLARMLD